MKKLEIIIAILMPLILVNGVIHCKAVNKALVECTHCDGEGQITTEYDCSYCDSGKVSCTNCRDGKQECSQCGGDAEVDVRCRDCGGHGHIGDKECGKCSGEGTVAEKCNRCTNGQITCPSCRGSGEVSCHLCDGSGVKKTTRVCDVCKGHGEVEG
jgi:DnaJ-class molecular chaperone